MCTCSQFRILKQCRVLLLLSKRSENYKQTKEQTNSFCKCLKYMSFSFYFSFHRTYSKFPRWHASALEACRIHIYSTRCQPDTRMHVLWSTTPFLGKVNHWISVGQGTTWELSNLWNSGSAGSVWSTIIATMEPLGQKLRHAPAHVLTSSGVKLVKFAPTTGSASSWWHPHLKSSEAKVANLVHVLSIHHQRGYIASSVSMLERNFDAETKELI